MAEYGVWIGSVGVSLLLVAFALNIIGKLDEKGRCYLIMNIVGSLLAAYYAYVGQIIPFVVLEVIWAGAAITQLFLTIKKAPR